MFFLRIAKAFLYHRHCRWLSSATKSSGCNKSQRKKPLWIERYRAVFW